MLCYLCLLDEECKFILCHLVMQRWLGGGSMTLGGRERLVTELASPQEPVTNTPVPTVLKVNPGLVWINFKDNPN